MTDQEIENSLQHEVRMLPMPGMATPQPFRMFAYNWKNYRFLTERGGLTPEQLTGWAQEFSQESGRTLGEELEDLVNRFAVAWLEKLDKLMEVADQLTPQEQDEISREYDEIMQNLASQQK